MVPCDLLSNFTTMERGAGGTHVSHLRGWQCTHHQSTRPDSSSSRLNGILNMAGLTLWAAIKHLEEFSPSNYICHCQPFSGNRDLSPKRCFQQSEWCQVKFIIHYSVINFSHRTAFGGLEDLLSRIVSDNDYHWNFSDFVCTKYQWHGKHFEYTIQKRIPQLMLNFK